MQAKTLKIGTSNFKDIIAENGYFVDKSLLAKEFIENWNYIILITRPKRFGKTLNLSMLEYFFDIQKINDKNLFDDLKISKDTVFCQEHQNKYPVINLSLKSIKETNWNNCLNNFKNIISNLYQNFEFLLKSEKISETEKDFFKKIITQKGQETDYKFSLVQLSKFLKKHFNQKVIIFIDEYDAPIINAYKNTNKPIKANNRNNPTYYEQVISFMQTFLGETFKGNEINLKKGLLTGVMRIGRESIFSEWNNFSVFGVTSPYFDDKFGFTQDELDKLLEYFKISDKENLKYWYDGYKFGHTNNIYNPWSIVNYIARQKEGFKPYWVNTTDDTLIKERIAEPDIKNAIEELIKDKTIIRTINDNFIFPDFEADSELLWTLLLYGGFLTQIKNIDFNRYELKIPNRELKFVFKNLILEWIRVSYKFNQELLISTANHLITNNLQDFEKGFKRIIGDTLSYFDTQNKNITQEQIFHVYTLGLLAILTDKYIIKSNRESGLGRYDIMLIPFDKKQNGVIIEIKITEPQKSNETYKKFAERINKKISEAITQIKHKKYFQELLDNNIKPENIITVPIIFAGKEPYITKLETNIIN